MFNFHGILTGNLNSINVQISIEPSMDYWRFRHRRPTGVLEVLVLIISVDPGLIIQSHST